MSEQDKPKTTVQMADCTFSLWDTVAGVTKLELLFVHLDGRPSGRYDVTFAEDSHFTLRSSEGGEDSVIHLDHLPIVLAVIDAMRHGAIEELLREIEIMKARLAAGLPIEGLSSAATDTSTAEEGPSNG